MTEAERKEIARILDRIAALVLTLARIISRRKFITDADVDGSD